jgi:hypothetical protein
VTYQKMRAEAEALDERSYVIGHLGDRELAWIIAGGSRIAEPA